MLQAVVNGIVHHLNKESSMTVLSLVLDKTEEYLKDSSGDAPRVSIVKLAVLLNILASCRRGTFLKGESCYRFNLVRRNLILKTGRQKTSLCIVDLSPFGLIIPSRTDLEISSPQVCDSCVILL